LFFFYLVIFGIITLSTVIVDSDPSEVFEIFLVSYFVKTEAKKVFSVSAFSQSVFAVNPSLIGKTLTPVVTFV
jgi:hypothetical protein